MSFYFINGLFLDCAVMHSLSLLKQMYICASVFARLLVGLCHSHIIKSSSWRLQQNPSTVCIKVAIVVLKTGTLSVIT